MTQTSTDIAAKIDLTGDYLLDPTHSRVGFVARHAMITKVRGAFDEFEGRAHIDAADPSKSTATVTIQAESINTRNEQRDAHLRTNDFLDMENFPELTFTSTQVQAVDDTNFRVSGDLTIRGVAKSVTVDLEFTGVAKDPFGNVRVGFDGSTTINRKDWGVNWNAPLETGGVLVGEKVVLEFEISAIKLTPTA